MAYDPTGGLAGDKTGGGGSSSSGGGTDWGGLAVSVLPAVWQGIQGAAQARKARRLKEKDFQFLPPSLLANKALAQQQAFSRRAPGSALANENIRRNLATTLSAGARMYGGDANKMATLAGGAEAKAFDASKQVDVLGQQFSENAFNRLQQTNAQLGGQERQNYTDFWKTKQALLYASDQNIFNAINNVSSAALMTKNGKNGGGGGYGYGGYGGYMFPNPYMNFNPQYNAYPPQGMASPR